MLSLTLYLLSDRIPELMFYYTLEGSVRRYPRFKLQNSNGRYLTIKYGCCLDNCSENYVLYSFGVIFYHDYNMVLSASLGVSIDLNSFMYDL